MKLLLFVLASVLIAVSQASTSLDTTPVVFFNRGSVPSQWVQEARATPTSGFYFSVAVKQNNIDVLDEKLQDISDPNSPNYAEWLSFDEIDTLIASDPVDMSQISKWLISEGCEITKTTSDMIFVQSTVATAERLFSTELFEFSHINAARVIVRSAAAYSVPTFLVEKIDLIVGLSEFPNLKSNKASPKDNDVSQGYVIPATIRNVYNIPGSASASQTSVAVAEFQDDSSFNKDDLHQFDSQTSEPRVDVGNIVGPYDGSQPDGESTLDIQYASAIATNAPSSGYWFWTVQEWMLEFANDLYTKVQSGSYPQVVSISWGWPENEQCQLGVCSGFTSKSYIARVNTEFLKITSAGVSFFASSGDQGAPGDGNSGCDNSNDPLSTIFPGASPYITCVGATMLSSNGVASPWAGNPSYNQQVCTSGQYTCATTTKEAVCSYPDALITTGGGFSDYTPRPSWQKDAVAGYLNNTNVNLPPSRYYNAQNRAFPDVSALGHAYLIYIGGSFEQVDGTSCSSPVFAAMAALLNNKRIASGKKPVGFMNPALYDLAAKNPSAWKDITTGNNKCTEECCANFGFEAAPGWDPTVGLGTPNFEALDSYFASLQ